MVNKQIMKVSIIQIGFAVISIGMMLIILGINGGGAETSAALLGTAAGYVLSKGDSDE